MNVWVVVAAAAALSAECCLCCSILKQRSETAIRSRWFKGRNYGQVDLNSSRGSAKVSKYSVLLLLISPPLLAGTEWFMGTEQGRDL